MNELFEFEKDIVFMFPQIEQNPCKFQGAVTQILSETMGLGDCTPRKGGGLKLLYGYSSALKTNFYEFLSLKS